MKGECHQQDHAHKQGAERVGPAEAAFLRRVGKAEQNRDQARRQAAQMVAGDGDERFRFAIDVVIAGVVARAARR